MQRMSVVLLMILAIVATACGSNSDRKDALGPIEVQAATPTALDKIQTQLEEVKSHRRASEGWAANVRPGDSRTISMIDEDLRQLESLQLQVEALPNNDKSGRALSEIRESLLADLRLMLKMSVYEGNLFGLEEFLRIAPNQDTNLEEFGTTPDKLRAEALRIARQDIAELRSRLPTSGDAVGSVLSILQEWQFTPKELGLTPAEEKLLRP